MLNFFRRFVPSLSQTFETNSRGNDLPKVTKSFFFLKLNFSSPFLVCLFFFRERFLSFHKYYLLVTRKHRVGHVCFIMLISWLNVCFQWVIPKCTRWGGMSLRILLFCVLKVALAGLGFTSLPVDSIFCVILWRFIIKELLKSFMCLWCYCHCRNWSRNMHEFSYPFLFWAIFNQWTEISLEEQNTNSSEEYFLL